MNRRGFLTGLLALVGGVALEQAIPFGRVWSFPKNIVISRAPHAIPGRIDSLSMKHWFRIENEPLDFCESTGQRLCPLHGLNGDIHYLTVGGQTVFPTYQA